MSNQSSIAHLRDLSACQIFCFFRTPGHLGSQKRVLICHTATSELSVFKVTWKLDTLAPRKYTSYREQEIL